MKLLARVHIYIYIRNCRLAAMAVVTIACMLMTGCGGDVPENPVQRQDTPTIFPDYIGVTVPVGIAPLNFNYAGKEDIDIMDVVVKGQRGAVVHSSGKYADFDIDEWHELLEQNKGGRLTVTVCTKNNGTWTQYRDFNIHVSRYSLDEWGLTYRRIAPGYEIYSTMEDSMVPPWCRWTANENGSRQTMMSSADQWCIRIGILPDDTVRSQRTRHDRRSMWYRMRE